MGLSVLLVLLAWQPDAVALRRVFEEALARREAQFGRTDARTAQAARDLGKFLALEGDRAAAVVALRRVVEIDEVVAGAEDERTLSDVAELAGLTGEPGLWERAATARDGVVAARALDALGAMREARGDAAGAVQAYRQALAREVKASGATAAKVAVRLNALALAVGPQEGVGLLQRAVTINRTALGTKHPETASTMTNLSGMLLASGRVAEAVQLGTQAVTAFEAALGEHPRTAAAVSNLADAFRAQGAMVRAEGLYRRALAIDLAAYGPGNPETQGDARNLAEFLREVQRIVDAEKVEREYGFGR